MADRYSLSDKQIYGSDVDDHDMDAILKAMARLDANDTRATPDAS
jgi:hypothetical protein